MGVASDSHLPAQSFVCTPFVPIYLLLGDFSTFSVTLQVIFVFPNCPPSCTATRSLPTRSLAGQSLNLFAASLSLSSVSSSPPPCSSPPRFVPLTLATRLLALGQRLDLWAVVLDPCWSSGRRTAVQRASILRCCRQAAAACCPARPRQWPLQRVSILPCCREAAAARAPSSVAATRAALEVSPTTLRRKEECLGRRFVSSTRRHMAATRSSVAL